AALNAFHTAWSHAPPRARTLVARIAFEIGSVHIMRSEVAAAETILLSAQRDTGTGPPLADLLHLEALVHDANGVANQARDLYRATVAHAKNALTPVTQVLALRNLGAALCHGLPEGSVGLYRLALRVLDAS